MMKVLAVRDAALSSTLSILKGRKGSKIRKALFDFSRSQICPNCYTHTGKKNLSNRVHFCQACGYTTNRDVAASQVIRNRGLVAAYQPVTQIASGGVLSGVDGNIDLDKCL